MRPIQDDDELIRLHRARVGFIYNDFSGEGAGGAANNVLHAAHCDEIERSNTNVRKFFCETLAEATAWLSNHRGPEGENWKRCGICGAREPEA